MPGDSRKFYDYDEYIDENLDKILGKLTDGAKRHFVRGYLEHKSNYPVNQKEIDQFCAVNECSDLQENLELKESVTLRLLKGLFGEEAERLFCENQLAWWYWYIFNRFNGKNNYHLRKAL